MNATPSEDHNLAFWKQADAPANPLNFLPGQSVWERVGLTKRETFAAMAMQGLLSNPEHANLLNDHASRSEVAVKAADALLKELAK